MDGVDMTARQYEREEQQWKMGVDRIRKQLESTGVSSSRKATGDILDNAVAKMIPVIEGHVRAIEEGTVNVHHTPVAIQYLTEFNPEAVAYIAVRECLDAGANEQKLTRSAMRLSNLIAEAVEFDEAEQAEPDLMRYMAGKAKRWPKVAQKRRILRKAAQVAGIKRMGWTEAEKLKLGIKLIELVIEHTGLVVFEEHMDTARASKTVQRYKQLKLHPVIAEALMTRTEALGEIYPYNQPMIVPPVDWTGPRSGGYLRFRMSLVRGTRRDFRDELENLELPDLYKAVNLIQSTKWRINEGIHDIIEEAWRTNTQLGGLPYGDDETLPELPKFMIDNPKLREKNMSDGEKAVFTDWKHRARLVHEINGKRKSQRLALSMQLRLARDLRQYDQFYFPHSLDFRGRIYPLTGALSPQSDDASKALIAFAEGKKLGESGGFWLCVHIANLFGEDKMSFEDRVAWTMMRKDQLIDSARDPLDGYRFWDTADDPWCALAACIEFAGWMEQGDDYVSHLPISMDGTCSGIQHLSALLRDRRGAEAVNLVANDKPADIYVEVLEETKRLLAEDSTPLAKVWLDKVDRKIVKRPCMTFAYSVTSTGIRNQIDEEIRKRQDGDYLPGTPNWEAAQSLAPVVEQAIRNVVERPAEAMKWLTDCARLINKQGNRTRWTTPLGLPVIQPYMKTRAKTIKVYFAGEKALHVLRHSINSNETEVSNKDEKRLRLTIQEETNIPNGKKQTSSIAPNVVHSLDATHLMMVVNRLADEGITDQYYAMVHDSFGVHATDVDEMNFIIRDEFIKLYSEDILTKLYQEFLLQLPGDKWPDLPLPPTPGEYNIEEVRDADFFFA
jgi:DNA-directed RNA polymerase